MTELFFLFNFIIFGTLFALAAMFAGFVCSYKSETNEKASLYECGMKLFSDARALYDIKYFNFAIVFLIFDVETIFLFPFAMCFGQLELFTVVEIIIFLVLLLVALFYAINKKILWWQK